MNKLTVTGLSTVVLMFFSHATFADESLTTTPGDRTNPSIAEKATLQRSNLLVLGQPATLQPKSALSKSVKTDPKNNVFSNENYNWVPSEWYSPY